MQNYNINYNNYAQNTAKNNTNINRSKIKPHCSHLPKSNDSEEA